MRNYNRRPAHLVEDKIRRLCREELKTLANPAASQTAKREALARLDAERRQRPASSKRDRDIGVHNTLPEMPSIEQEMTQDCPEKKHGYEVAPGGYAEYSSARVRTSPKVQMGTYNQTNPGYRDAAVAPSDAIRLELSKEETNFVDSVSNAIRRLSEGQGIQRITQLERFEQSGTDFSQKQLYVIAKDIGVMHEAYSSTAGEWVVTMPHSKPKSAEDIVYNQVGVSGRTARELEKIQQADYGKNAARIKPQYKQLPPAQPAVAPMPEYSPGDGKSQAALRDPKRAEDWLRFNKLSKSQMEETVQYWEEEAEKEPNTFLKDQLKKRAKAGKNIITARGAMDRETNEQGKKKDCGCPVESYAATLSGMNNRAGELVEQYGSLHEARQQEQYRTHISLLEEAKRLLDK